MNRAVGKWYGLGSTFKVVIAAAYLSGGGHPDDELDAPLTVPLAPEVVIHNAGGGACPGGESGTITLTRALAVSCNTAFVTLAARLGWPAIAEQARRFGMTVGACRDEKPAFLAHRGAGTVESCVPADVDGVAIGNNTLGGQDVQGTPMAMATVLAAIANGGTTVAPTLLRSVRHPGSERSSTRSAGRSPPSTPRWRRS
ncbi:penicillin-binding transpeptidase domain-containing protein [Luedemannella flava]